MVARACNPSYSGGWGRRITWTQEVEIAVSWDHAIALQPGQQELNFISKKKKNQSFVLKIRSFFLACLLASLLSCFLSFFPSFLLFFLFFFKLYFKFWDTCAEHAGLLHRYMFAMVFAESINPSCTLGISPNTVPPLVPQSWQVPMCDIPLPVSVCSHCSVPTYEWKYVVSGFLFLC